MDNDRAVEVEKLLKEIGEYLATPGSEDTGDWPEVSWEQVWEIDGFFRRIANLKYPPDYKEVNVIQWSPVTRSKGWRVDIFIPNHSYDDSEDKQLQNAEAMMATVDMLTSYASTQATQSRDIISQIMSNRKRLADYEAKVKTFEERIGTVPFEQIKEEFEAFRKEYRLEPEVKKLGVLIAQSVFDQVEPTRVEIRTLMVEDTEISRAKAKQMIEDGQRAWIHECFSSEANQFNEAVRARRVAMRAAGVKPTEEYAHASS